MATSTAYPTTTKRTSFAGSVQTEWVSMGSLKATADGLAQALLTANGTRVVEIPDGATYAALTATAGANSVTTAPVVEIYGVDGNGVITLLLSVSGNANATFAAAGLTQVDTALWVIREAASGDFLFDLRGSRKLIYREATQGAGTGAITGYLKFL